MASESKSSLSFSVIIPAYNRSNVLANAIFSVINQKQDDVEVIVVDDGSTDDTYSVVKQFSNVKYIKQNNSGPYIARQNGILMSTGEYVCFLDSDDEYKDGFFSILEKYIIKHNFPDFVHFAFDVFCNDTFSYYGSSKKEKVLLNKSSIIKRFIFSSNENELCRYCFKKSVVNVNNRLPTTSLIGEDMLMAFYFLLGCTKGVYINESIYVYNLSPKNNDIDCLISIISINYIILEILKKSNISDNELVEKANLKYTESYIGLFDKLFIEGERFRKINAVFCDLKKSYPINNFSKIGLSTKNKLKVTFINKPCFLYYVIFKFYYFLKHFLRKLH